MRNVVSAVLLSLPPLVAQAATAPVSPPALNARAAFAVAVLEDVVRERDAAVAADGGPRLDRSKLGALSMADCRTVFVHVGADGAIGPMRGSGIFVPDPVDRSRWALYAFDGTPDGSAGAVLFLAADGQVLWSAGGARAAAAQRAPNAAFAGGGRKWDARLRGAGTGADGIVWRAASELPRREVAVTVVADEPGVLAEAAVWVVPSERGGATAALLPSALPLAGAWPAGIAAADRSGRARLRGIAAEGLAVRVLVADTVLTLPPGALQASAGALRITVAKANAARGLRANESAAFAALKNIASGQAQCQASGVIDVDGDGLGEHGFFAELAGAVAVRTDVAGALGKVCIAPPILSTIYGAVRASRVERSGYRMQMYLQGRDGAWVAENLHGGARGVAVDPDRAEQQWCCFAWPVRAGWSGQRAFFVGADGEALEHANDGGAFSGDRAPAPWTSEQPPAGWQPAVSAAPSGR